MEHPIQEFMNISMRNLSEMIDVDTVIGKAIHTPNGDIIIPVSKVGFGYATGGTEFPTEDVGRKYPFGGGSGGGVSISPVAFLVISNNEVKLIHLHEQTHVMDKVIDAVPQLIQKVKDVMGNEALLNEPPTEESTLGVNSDTPLE